MLQPVVLELLAQCAAIDAEHLRCLRLIARANSHHRFKKRDLDLREHHFIKAAALATIKSAEIHIQRLADTRSDRPRLSEASGAGLAILLDISNCGLLHHPANCNRFIIDGVMGQGRKGKLGQRLTTRAAGGLCFQQG